jgi:hypothetical protein
MVVHIPRDLHSWMYMRSPKRDHDLFFVSLGPFKYDIFASLNDR